MYPMIGPNLLANVASTGTMYPMIGHNLLANVASTDTMYPMIGHNFLTNVASTDTITGALSIWVLQQFNYDLFHYMPSCSVTNSCLVFFNCSQYV